MVSVCLPSHALLQHLLSNLGFSYLGRGVSLHGCFSKAQPLLLTLDEGYLLTATPPDLEHGIAPLGPLAPAQPLLLERGVGPPGRHPLASVVGLVLLAATPDLGRGVSPLGRRPWAQGVGSFSRLPPLALGVEAWGSSSWLPPLTSDVG